MRGSGCTHGAHFVSTLRSLTGHHWFSLAASRATTCGCWAARFLLRWVVRGVRQERRVPDEERFLLRESVVDEVENRRHAFAADPEAVVAVASAGLGKPR
jgi:hypothetical protein